MSMKKIFGASFETLEIPDHSSFLLESTRIYQNRGVEGAGLRLKQASPREPPAKFSEIGAYNISCHVLGRDVIKSEYFHDFWHIFGQ